MTVKQLCTWARREMISSLLPATDSRESAETYANLWFIRLAAIRYMEIKGYSEDGWLLSLSDMSDGDFYSNLKSKNDLLSHSIGCIFSTRGGLCEPFPVGSLGASGVARALCIELTSDELSDVRAIGWLHQYYNSELKDDTFAALKKKVKIPKERIPAATQLFTPDFIVKYLVESSVGGQYVRSKLSDVPKELRPLREEELARELGFEFYLAIPGGGYCDGKMELESYKIIDPCMGAGHILVYALEVLVEIYKKEGVPPSVSARKILENNLFGADIDPTVSALGAFSLLMRAAEYDASVLTNAPRLLVASISDGETLTDSEIDLLSSGDGDVRSAISRLATQMSGGSEYGSLIRISRDEVDAVREKIGKISTQGEAYDRFLGILRCAELLSDKYDAVITNPPYMGKKNLNTRLADYLDKNYKAGKGELYSAFILRALDMAKPGGAVSMITIHSWMFISSFARLRKRVLDESYIETLVHTGAGTFEELNSFNVLASAFCLRKGRRQGAISRFLSLGDLRRPDEKARHFHDTGRVYDLSDREFLSIPGTPLAYSLSEKQRASFTEHPRLGDCVFPRVGLQTGDNARFVRYWFEVKRQDIAIGAKDSAEVKRLGARFVPYNKGGNFRKWYGMNEYVVDWTDGGNLVFNSPGSAPNNRDFYFKEGITWSLFGFENFGVRYKEPGFVFDVSGASLFPCDEDRMYILAFLSSSVAFSYLSVLAPTVNFQAGNVADLPFATDSERKAEISALASRCVEICREEWQSREESWDFERHPLVEYGVSLDRSYPVWEKRCFDRYSELKSCEERINRLFAEIYGIADSHNTTVSDRDMSVLPADRKRDITRLISYAVGACFGRFDRQDGRKYPTIIEICREPLGLASCVKEAIWPLLRSGGADFVKASLGGWELDEYLENGFYSDHIKLYKKHPIYWQVESGRLGAFRALIYYHSLDRNTLSRLRILALQRRERLCLISGDKASLAKASEIDAFVKKIDEYIDTHPRFDINDGVECNRAKIEKLLKKVK